MRFMRKIDETGTDKINNKTYTVRQEFDRQ